MAEAIDSTMVSQGGVIDRFEKDFCAFHGRGGVAVSSGTSALFLALKAMGVGKNDEVIVPGYTFAACVNMVLTLGAKVVYADIDPHTWCLDPADVERRLTSKTKAIIAVHLYGHMCDMPSLMKVRKDHKIKVIEDAAEAVFSRYRDRLAGTWGDAGCFSFQAAKTITTGEGGFILSASAKTAQQLRILRDHGMNPRKRYWHDHWGFNSRLTNLQAALGCAQWEERDKIIAERRRIFQWYVKAFADMVGVSRQQSSDEEGIVPWVFAVKLDPRRFRFSRDRIIQVFTESKIGTRPGFYTFSQMPFYAGRKIKNCEDVSCHAIVFPLYPGLTFNQITLIAGILRSCQK